MSSQKTLSENLVERDKQAAHAVAEGIVWIASRLETDPGRVLAMAADVAGTSRTSAADLIEHDLLDHLTVKTQPGFISGDAISENILAMLFVAKKMLVENGALALRADLLETPGLTGSVRVNFFGADSLWAWLDGVPGRRDRASVSIDVPSDARRVLDSCEVRGAIVAVGRAIDGTNRLGRAGDASGVPGDQTLTAIADRIGAEPLNGFSEEMSVAPGIVATLDYEARARELEIHVGAGTGGGRAVAAITSIYLRADSFGTTLRDGTFGAAMLDLARATGTLNQYMKTAVGG